MPIIILKINHVPAHCSLSWFQITKYSYLLFNVMHCFLKPPKYCFCARTWKSAFKWELVRHKVFPERRRSWIFLFTQVYGKQLRARKDSTAFPSQSEKCLPVIQKYVHHRVGWTGEPFAISEAYMLLSVSNMPEALLSAQISPLSSSIGNWCSPCLKDIRYRAEKRPLTSHLHWRRGKK